MRSGMIANAPRWAKASEAHMQEYVRQVDEKMAKYRNSKYIPRSRHGKYFVWEPNYNAGTNVDGTPRLGWFSVHEDKADWESTRKQMLTKGYKPKFGELQRVNEERGLGFHDMPTSDVLKMAIDGDGDAAAEIRARTRGVVKSIAGFDKHLIKSFGVKGWTTDLDRPLAEYFSSLARWEAQKNYIKESNEIMANRELVSPNDEKLLNMMKERQKYLTTYTNEWAAYRKFLGLWYLSRPISALVNATQNFTVTLPKW